MKVFLVFHKLRSCWTFLGNLFQRAGVCISLHPIQRQPDLACVSLSREQPVHEQEPDRLQQLMQLLVGKTVSACPHSPHSHHHLSPLVIRASLCNYLPLSWEIYSFSSRSWDHYWCCFSIMILRQHFLFQANENIKSPRLWTKKTFAFANRIISQRWLKAHR